MSVVERASIYVFTVRTNTNFRTQSTQLSYIIIIWPSPGTFCNNTHSKEYRGGGLPFAVNLLE